MKMSDNFEHLEREDVCIFWSIFSYQSHIHGKWIYYSNDVNA